MGRDHYHNHNEDMREDTRELSSVERGANCNWKLFNSRFLFYFTVFSFLQPKVTLHMRAAPEDAEGRRTIMRLITVSMMSPN